MPARAPPFSTPADVSAQEPAAMALPYPVLSIHLLNDCFVPQHIDGQHYAEVWEEGGVDLNQGCDEFERDVEAELNTLTGAMSEIYDTLTGRLTNLPPYPPPLLRLPTRHLVSVELQVQLRDTQSKLAGQVDKIRALKAVLSEQESTERGVETLREMIESRQRELEGPKGGFEDDEGDEGDDDARSVSAVVPHELESVEEEDESEEVDLEKETEDRDRREVEAEGAAREELERRNETDPGRPHTPEPLATPSSSSNLRVPSPLSQSPTGVVMEEIQEQIVQLTAQVSAVVALTSRLGAQHTAAQSTIRALERKVEQLESLLRALVAPAPAPVPEPTPVEEEKEVVKEEAEEERGESKELLSERITEWMKTSRSSGITGSRVRGAGSQRICGGYGGRVGNGDVVKHNGLVTPPSPRSQSGDSGRYRRRVRRRNTAAAAKKEESASASDGESGDTDEEEGVERSLGSTSLATSACSSFGVSTGASALANATADTAEDLKEKVIPTTPEASVYQDKLTTLSKAVVEHDAEVVKEEPHEGVSGKAVSDRERNIIHVQTAVGVLLLSVAAAYWVRGCCPLGITPSYLSRFSPLRRVGRLRALGAQVSSTFPARSNSRILLSWRVHTISFASPADVSLPTLPHHHRFRLSILLIVIIIPPSSSSLDFRRLSAYNKHPMLTSLPRHPISILVMSARFAFFLCFLGSLGVFGLVNTLD
ncbi:hypothetical protein DFP72DRAFT_1180477 [Ephemerocybe angulata]|uniref:Uncharacterized protein n=1 Tax=Ephemerocybe angulata TaxID=980116 RepID=A0A8H6LSY3_9AGAR|nr:hypothetical protein DFP72DRAFT_1180477 [Tulosesus angulatus]